MGVSLIPTQKSHTLKKINIMKLIAASATLLAAINAQSVEVLLAELANKVYQVSDDGLTHTFNAAPYFQGVYTCLGEGFEGKSTFGNGNGVISYTEKADWTDGDHFSYDTTIEGTVKSIPWAAAYPADVQGDTFNKNVAFRVGAQGVSCKTSGNVNGFPYSMEAILTINEITMTSKKMMAEIEVSRNAEISSSINQYWQNMAIPSGSTIATIGASAKTACTELVLPNSSSPEKTTDKISVKMLLDTLSNLKKLRSQSTTTKTKSSGWLSPESIPWKFWHSNTKSTVVKLFSRSSLSVQLAWKPSLLPVKSSSLLLSHSSLL